MGAANSFEKSTYGIIAVRTQFQDKVLAAQAAEMHSVGALLMRHVETMALVIPRRFRNVTIGRDAGSMEASRELGTR